MGITFLPLSGVLFFGFLLLAHSFMFSNTPLIAQTGNMTSPVDKIGVKVTFPKANTTVPVGTLVVNGTSTDTSMTDCRVYVDWNDLKPMQNVTATGPKGTNDYSEWSFKYTQDYHLITEGPNELTSKIVCLNGSTGNSTTKFNSINVTGIKTNNSITPSKIPAYSNETNDSKSGSYQSVNLHGVLPQYNGGADITNKKSDRTENHSTSIQVIKPSDGGSSEHLDPEVVQMDLAKGSDDIKAMNNTNEGTAGPTPDYGTNTTGMDITDTSDTIEKIDTNKILTTNISDYIDSPVNMDEVHIAGVSKLEPNDNSKLYSSGDSANATIPFSDTKITDVKDSHDKNNNKNTESKKIINKDKALKPIKPKKLYNKDVPIPEWDNTDPFRAT